MGDLRDYLRWRGDISLAERAFNDVDNLVLCALAYLDLGGVIPAPGGGSVSVRVAAERLTTARSAAPPGGGDRRLALMPAALLTELAAARRFSGAELSDYVDLVDERVGTQFAALSVHLDDGTTYVAYRGTDNTLVGWREDFTMSFQEVPAQASAAEYLSERLTEHDRPVRVGGHSKGGNLASFAAMRLGADPRERVVAVYNNDGPGFSPEVVDAEAYAWLATRLTKVVPQFAVVGMLFERGTASHVVTSSARGLMQHDLMTWQVEGADLMRADGLSPQATALNRAIDSWLEGAAREDRRAFTEAFFQALAAGGATLVVDVASTEYGSFESVLFALRRSRGQTRRPVRLGLTVALRAVADVGWRRVVRERRTVRAGLLLVLGAFLAIVPHVAVQILGALAVLTFLVVATTRLIRHLLRFRDSSRLSRRSAVALVASGCAVLAVISRLDLLVVPTNVLLGVCLLAGAWSHARAAVSVASPARGRSTRSILLLVSAAVAFLMGVTALSTAGLVLPMFVMQVGGYCLVVGALEAYFSLRDASAPSLARLTADAYLPTGP
ncbi:Mbeg1-like protein [Cellulomonas soli]|uniref:Beta-carotene 15,15'-monooxygenase n=1 Tax=Cellulomonas soli TaxID=931535 RepID=A0A512PD18_9CELL|nr:Mbeg1-like protein [Cellulomonas soli]NYI60267.1 hypothetical protein [Cellulomonas soli]GEP69078.1 beta-carotene 15,15'-monooxygenase [Cellulomonas soli]